VRRDVVCLAYHAVSAAWPSPLAVSAEQLEYQVSWLVRRGWTGTTFQRAVLDPPAGRTFAVTFDDAFESVIERALPVLSRLGVPATVFAPTAFMSARQQLTWPGIDHWAESAHADELTSMNWDDLRTLAGHGWEIGSHTRSHPHLDELDDAALRAELVDSRLECSSQLGSECLTLAYPYGSVDRRVAAAARKAGYRAAAATSPPRERDVMRQPRVGVYRVDRPRRFQVKIRARHLYGSSVWRAVKPLVR
jgi:peptidoglycan/xylan/chitin deacetylase (PgdA/CDA1 family)